MKAAAILLMLLLAVPALAYEALLPMSGALTYRCNQVPTWAAGFGYAEVSSGRCMVRVIGEDAGVGGDWFGYEWQAAFDVVSSSCDSLTAVFYYLDRGLTWRAVPVLPVDMSGGKATAYRTPVLPGLKFPGHLEISGYGRNVSFSVARARVEWRWGTVNKDGEMPSTWGALKGIYR